MRMEARAGDGWGLGAAHRCHLPTCPVLYPWALRAAASVSSLSGRPPLSVGPPTRAAPVPAGIIPLRMGSLPVMSAARLGVQRLSPLYHCVKRRPSSAMVSIAPRSCVGWP